MPVQSELDGVCLTEMTIAEFSTSRSPMSLRPRNDEGAWFTSDRRLRVSIDFIKSNDGTGGLQRKSLGGPLSGANQILRAAISSCGAAVEGKPAASAVGCGIGNRSREAAKREFSSAAILSPLTVRLRSYTGN